MFAQKRDYTVEVAAAYALFEGKPRGTHVEHDEIADATRFAHGSPEYMTVIRKVKSAMLAKRGIELEAVQGVGYRLVTAEDQLVKRRLRDDKSIARKRRRSLRALASIPATELTETQFAYQAAAFQLGGNQDKEHKVAQAQLTSWLSAPETLPKPVRKGIQ